MVITLDDLTQFKYGTGDTLGSSPVLFCFVMRPDLWLKQQMEDALLALTNPDNIDQQGLVSPADTAEAYTEMFMSIQQLPIVGAIIPVMRAASSLSPNLLPCDGSLYLLSDYPVLAGVIDPTWIQPDTTHFAVPDLRTRAIVGSGSSSFDGTSYSNGQTIGTRALTLSEANMPAHVHGVSEAVAAVVNGGLEAPAAVAEPVPTVTGSAGSGTAFDPSMPGLALQFCVIAF